MSAVDYRLTTIDNPYDPFDEWDNWYSYDVQQNYFTTELLDRVSFNSEELSDEDQLLATEQAIDDIIAVDTLLIYRKVGRKV